jgi:PAS domain S-box-containing protein
LTEAVYKEIIDGYPEGIVLLDRDNIVVDVNDAFVAITGFLKKDVLGLKNLPELLKPQDDEGGKILVSEAFRACFCDDPISTAVFNIVNSKGMKMKVVSTVFKTKSFSIL